MTETLIGMKASEAEELLTKAGIRFTLSDCTDRKTDTDGQRRVARVKTMPGGGLEVLCMYFHNDVYGA